MSVPSPTRRRLLAATAALGTAFAGCQALSSERSADEDATTTPRMGPKKRGRADPVSVETTIRRDDVDYVESKNLVRYFNPRAVEKDETPSADATRYTISFESWALSRCASAAARRVGEVVEKRLGEDATGVSAWVHRRSSIVVGVETHLNRDGDVVSTPNVDVDRVVPATPRSVTATISFAGRDHRETFPVFVRRSTRQNT